MRLLILFILLFFSTVDKAQGFRARIYTPYTLTGISKSIHEISTGNYFATGLALDTFQGKYFNHLVIMGLNNSGQVNWTKKYGNSKFNYLSNHIIRRSFYKQGNYIYHACCVRDSNNKQIGVLIKFDFNGDTIWQQIYKDPTDDVIPQMVTSSIDGGFLITGFFQGNNSPCMLIKTNANGKELWRKKISKINPDVSDGKAIIQDSSSKKIVIVGYQYLTGGDTHENVLVLDSLGNKLSQNYFNSFGGLLTDLIQTKDKRFVAVGQRIFPQTMFGDNLIKPFAVKFHIDSVSNPIWKIDNYSPLTLYNNFNCLYELSNEDLIIGGDIDTIHIKNLPENSLFRLTRISKNGTIINERLYDYSLNQTNSYLQSVSFLSPGSNSSVLAAFQLYNGNPNPMFFVKYDANGCDSTAAHCATVNMVGEIELEMLNYKFEIYPNPANEILNIERNPDSYRDLNSFDLNRTQIKITDITGREIQNIRIQNQENISINTKSYQTGIYFVSLIIEGIAIETKKLMIVR